MPALPLVSVVIPTYNRKGKLVRLIRSVLDGRYPKERLEIIVVDDASSDGTMAELKPMFPDITLIRNDREMLLAASRNRGIRSAKGDFIFVIDDDNILDKSCILELVSAFESEPRLGVVMPLMFVFKEHSRPGPLSEPPDIIWCAGIKRDMLTTRTSFLHGGQSDSGLGRALIPSQDFPNAFMLKREIISEIGLLDDKCFPIHYDEADFGERVRGAGYVVACFPPARLWHDSYSGINTLPKLVSSELRAYYTARNKIIFHKRHSKAWQFLVFFFFLNPAFALVFLRSILLAKGDISIHSRFRLSLSYLRGMICGSWSAFFGC